MESKEITPRDEMLHIMRVIWTSRKPEQLKGCQNMIDTFAKKHGENNIGITLMEIEMARQARLNVMLGTMKKVQDKLKENNAKNKGKK
jgi:hypothetical protein